MIYLCSPHTHPDPAVRRLRERVTCNVAAELIKAGVPVFSPIAYSIPLADAVGPDWGAWARFDLAMIDRCGDLWVSAQPGWTESVGTAREVMHYHRTREAFTGATARLLHVGALLKDVALGREITDPRSYTRLLTARELADMVALLHKAVAT